MKYRKKPVVIEAVRLSRKYFEDAYNFVGPENINHYNNGEFMEDICHIIIGTLEGKMIANEGDYIIKGIKGEFYPCLSDIFEMTYEKVQDEN